MAEALFLFFDGHRGRHDGKQTRDGRGARDGGLLWGRREGWGCLFSTCNTPDPTLVILALVVTRPHG
jgi:hypothetical protein